MRACGVPLCALTVAAAALVSPAPALAACARSADGPRFTASHRETSSRDGLRTVNAVCDRRRGVRWRLSSGVLREARFLTGTRVSPASVLGRRAAWTLVRVVRDVRRATILVADLRRRTIVRRKPLGRSRYGSVRLAVALLRGGRLAYSAWHDGPSALDHHRLVLPDGTVAEIGYFDTLRAEDGVTLVWSNNGATNYLDVLPPPMRDGCPARSRFRPATEIAGIRITRATYRVAGGSVARAWRACVVGTGYDPFIHSDGGSPGGTNSRSRVAAIVPNLVAFVTRQSRGPECESDAIHITDLRTRAVTREVGPCGGVANVRAEDRAIRWTYFGEPREARP